MKTGTSQAYHDNWTIGFTRDVTVGVWVGNFDRTPLQNSSGVTGAAPIFHDVMLAAQARLGGRAAGRGTTRSSTVRPTSRRARSARSPGARRRALCPRLETEWIPADRPAAPCRWHRRQSGRVVVDWPPAYRAWARQQGLLASTAPDALRRARRVRHERRPRPSGPRRAERLRIVNPPPGATYLFDPTLRAEFQTLPLRAVTESARRPPGMGGGRPAGGGASPRIARWTGRWPAASTRWRSAMAGRADVDS